MTVAVDKLSGLYEVDPEEAHATEDNILWAYVGKRALDGEREALEMIEWAREHKDRRRWYA